MSSIVAASVFRRYVVGFIALVDEFYDRRVKLIIAAAAPITDIYTGQRLKQEFKRTRSRLLEMQSHEYLATAHRP